MLHKKDPTLPCQYIGQTSRTLRERFGEHRRGIQNNTEESVNIHFNQPKHTLTLFSIGGIMAPYSFPQYLWNDLS